MRTIFIVEDDEDIRELTVYALENADCACSGFEDGNHFFSALEKASRPPDLVLLDIMLPGDDGLTILKKLRGHARYGEIPIIMLTAKGSEADKVKGLNFGADDYIAKPFGVTELIARIGAVLRRAKSAPMENIALTYRNITLDSLRHIATVDGEAVLLTFMEFELLHYLLLNADIVLSRDKLMDAVWGYDYEGESRTVDMHIKSLRQKLGAAGIHIKTVRNVGYKIGV
ncbi:MAG: response regulator transcription factor [Oscillospiraceae bacterium]|jgi:two-component system alkaline phosphatase synthesis response regulator PhoP|nr:response regulator transcription factor [Oscillospiraceae bacterium]